MVQKMQKRLILSVLLVLAVLSLALAVAFSTNFAVAAEEVADNNLRTLAGEDSFTQDLGHWDFGDATEKDYAYRPEHGSTVFYRFYNSGKSEPFYTFAVVYLNDDLNTSRIYFEAIDNNGNLEIDVDGLIDDANYLSNYIRSLRAGSYVMEVVVPAMSADEILGPHKHWWDESDMNEDYGIAFSQSSTRFTFSVATYAINQGKNETVHNYGVEITFPENRNVDYNASANNYVKPEIRIHGVLLEEGVDYTLSSTQVNVGWGSLTIKGKGSVTGQLVIAKAFYIAKATNNWQENPYIMHWTYKGYLPQVHLIKAQPIFLDDVSDMVFAVASDSSGLNILPGLEEFSLHNEMIGDEEKMVVSDEIAALLNDLPVGMYYLVAQVKGSDNYYAVESDIITFEVSQAINSWEIAPSVKSWTEGKFVDFDEHFSIAPQFGDAHIIITGDDEIVYYDSAAGINLLAGAKAGRYTLVATVEGSVNYSPLPDYTLIFNVFEKPGLPWWAVMLIVIGALALAAMIILILWKKGVFQILTEKLVVSIRTRASVEATIASVRAAKMMEEGRQSMEDAKRRERLEKMRQKAKELRDMSPEERAAYLEAKAKAEAERAEKLRARSEGHFARAAQMRTDDEQAENNETPTEE